LISQKKLKIDGGYYPSNPQQNNAKGEFRQIIKINLQCGKGIKIMVFTLRS
jgi:hypothetical protein